MFNRFTRYCCGFVFLITTIWIAHAAAAQTEDDEFARAMTLAGQQRFDEARYWFELGAQRYPGDKRFPLELAGVAFKQKDFSQAKTYLRRALDLDSRDTYGNDFLGTIYVLEGNLEAALKYWNRAGKPRIESIRVDPQPKLNSVLLDHAFEFAPASLLRSKEYYATKSRLDLLEVFPRVKFDLYAKEDSRFDIVLRAYERSGWGSTWWEGAIRTLRGLPYQTIYPEFYNIGNGAANFLSLLRWDSDRKRLYAEFSRPLGSDPGHRFRLSLDGRDESWLFPDNPVSSCCLDLRSWKAAFELSSIVNHSWEWSNTVSLSHRSFDLNQTLFESPQLFNDGYAVDFITGGTHQLIRNPEQRWTVQLESSAQFSRFFGDHRRFYGALRAGVRSHWLPQAKGDDYGVVAALRAGYMHGEVPFDALFTLGVDRDTDLWIRAHEQLGEPKGANPIGSNYVAANFEFDKIFYRGAFIQARVSPFVDAGKILEVPAPFSATRWLVDTGLQLKMKVLGAANLKFTYGKDLRSGRNVFYFSTAAN